MTLDKFGGVRESPATSRSDTEQAIGRPNTSRLKSVPLIYYILSGTGMACSIIGTGNEYTD